MSQILLTHSYFYKLDRKQWKFKQPYPPLGTIQAASVLRKENFIVDLFDSNLKNGPDEIIPMLQQKKPKYLVIYDDGFNYLTKMCLTVMREAALKMAGEGKKIGCTVIVCSSDSSDQYKSYLSQNVDYVVLGEGDETVTELLKTLENNSSVDHVKGIAYNIGTETTVTPSRPVLRNLDYLPLPAWDLIHIDEYRTIWEKYHGYFSLNLATTRGCPFKCNWCAKPIYGNRYNSRSPEHVAEEIEYLLTNFKPDHFWMCDDIFGLKPNWIQEFNAVIRKRNLTFSYKIQSRVDLLLEADTIKALADSGAETVWVGAESGSQRILDAMDKGTTVEQIYQTTELLKQHHVRPAFFLQFGYLGELKNDIDATLKMVLELMPDEIGISVSYPLPGTKFYERVKSMLKDKQNWSDSDDLSMMFENTYSPSYYKVLHRYVHNRYRIQRGINQLKKSFSVSKASLKNVASMLYNIPFAMMNGHRLNKLSRT